MSAEGRAYPPVVLPSPLVESHAPGAIRTVEELTAVREAISEIDDAAPVLTLAAPEGPARIVDGEAPAEPRWPFVDRRIASRESDRLERIVNVVIAATALILLAPIMLLVALAIRLTSSGPILYTQERVGRDHRSGRERRRVSFGKRSERRQRNTTGRIFTIYKFRTMRVDAEMVTGAVWAQKNDPRVTRLGKVLRVTRLDELPQLWNVLRGDMNIVGPRPERPQIILNLVRDIREYPARHRTRPGITGWAQIQAAYDSSLDDVRRKVRYDLEYLEQRSILLDLKIMAKTIPVMLFKKLGW